MFSKVPRQCATFHPARSLFLPLSLICLHNLRIPSARTRQLIDGYWQPGYRTWFMILKKIIFVEVNFSIELWFSSSCSVFRSLSSGYICLLFTRVISIYSVWTHSHFILHLPIVGLLFHSYELLFDPRGRSSPSLLLNLFPRVSHHYLRRERERGGQGRHPEGEWVHLVESTEFIFDQLSIYSSFYLSIIPFFPTAFLDYLPNKYYIVLHEQKNEH